MTDYQDWKEAHNKTLENIAHHHSELHRLYSALAEQEAGAAAKVLVKSMTKNKSQATHAKSKRNLAIWKERKEQGTTFRALGVKYNVGPERIRQIVAKEDRRQKEQTEFRILRHKDVRERLGLCSASLFRMVANGEFPKPFQITPRGRAVGWLEEDVDNWILSRIEDRRQKEQISDGV